MVTASSAAAPSPTISTMMSAAPEHAGGDLLIDRIVIGHKDAQPADRRDSAAVPAMRHSAMPHCTAGDRAVGRLVTPAVPGRSGRVNQKVLPWDTTLSTPIRPPIRSTSRLLIAKPETGTAGLATSLTIHLIEHLEKAGLAPLRDADAAIADFEPQIAFRIDTGGDARLHPRR